MLHGLGTCAYFLLRTHCFYCQFYLNFWSKHKEKSPAQSVIHIKETN